MSLLAWLSPTRWLMLAGVLAAAIAGYLGWSAHLEHVGVVKGRAQTQLLWDAERAQLQARALEEQQANAKESLRRIERQQENDRVYTQQLASARADADRNGRAAEQLRIQSATTARQWRDALDHSPTGEQCAAAGAAIGVLTDLLGRADRRAGILASYADTARAAGLKCERDYDALTPP